MKRKIAFLRMVLHMISAITLVVGLSSAVWIYRNAANKSYGALGYEGGDGSTYPIMPEDSKKYLRDLELYGGRANVLLDEVRREFLGLWHGKSFAFIVGGFSIFASFAVFYVANHLPSRSQFDVPGDDHREKTDQ